MAEQHMLLRQALPAAVSWDPETRQAVVIGSTDAPQADGLALVHDRAAIRWPARPLPVFVNHDAHPREFIGSVTALELGREKGAAALICTVQLADSEAGRLAEPMVASGAARWSISARIHRLEPGPAGSDYDRATDWEPIELSLVGAGMDSAAVTRSAESITTTAPEGSQMTIKNIAIDREEVTLDGIERRRCTAILDCARKLKVGDELAHKLIADGVALDEARLQLIDAKAQDELRTPAIARSWEPGAEARHWPKRGAEALAEKLGPCFKGTSQRSTVRVLEDWLIETGQLSRHDSLSAAEIVRRVWSTSDFQLAAQAVGAREVVNGYQAAQNGLLDAAARKVLPDFRPFSSVRFSQLGALPGKKEGGEYKTTGFSEELGYELIAGEFGTVIPYTRKLAINDDLGMQNRLLVEAGRAGAETERDLLASALTTITWTARNSTSSSTLGIEALGAGVLLLRRQIDAEKRPISFEPDLVLAAPEHELVLRQLMADYQPAAAGDVQPFGNLRLAIDHRLTAGKFYMVDTRYQPLIIGSIGDPVVSTSEDFKTGNLMIRVQHDAGAAVADTRSICKVTIGT